MSERDIFEWEITGTESSQRVRIFLKSFFTLPVLTFIGIGILVTLTRMSFRNNIIIPSWRDTWFDTQIILVILGITGISTYFYLRFGRFSFFRRSYRIDEVGVFIQHGWRKKAYRWGDFESWTRERQYDTRHLDMLGEKETAKLGEAFYLKKKPTPLFRRWYKHLVVIYGEPENYRWIAELLGQYLPYDERGEWSGLTSYEFR